MNGIINAIIGGKSRSLRFGTNSTAKYCEIRGCMLEDYINDLSTFILAFGKKDDDLDYLSGLKGDEIRDLIYAGLWAFDITEGNQIDYNQFVVGNWIDEAEQKEVNKIFQELLASNATKVKGDKGTGEKKS